MAWQENSFDGTSHGSPANRASRTFCPGAFRDLASAPPAADAAVLFLGLLPSTLGFVLWGYGVARNTVTTATAALYLVPVVALAVAYAWLGEVPGPAELAGGAVSIGGVALIGLRRSRPKSVMGTFPASGLEPAPGRGAP
jgi:drug/metabolite transporter (DMT)-like permease